MNHILRKAGQRGFSFSRIFSFILVTMKTLVLAAFLILVALIQEAFSLEISILSFSLSFYLVVSFIFIFLLKTKSLLLSSLLAGIILDIFSFSYFGVFTFAFILSGFLVEKISTIFKKSSPLVFILLFTLFFLFYNLFLRAGNFLMAAL